MSKKKEKLKKKFEINEGHYFEVLDRAYVICEMIDTLIGTHPLISEEIEDGLKKKYNNLMHSAWEFYQEAGHAEYVNSPDYVKPNVDDKEIDIDHLRPIFKDMPDDYQIDN